MTRIPDNWPNAALPARMNDECAAYFLGVSVAKLRLGVKSGKYPAPVKDGGNTLWNTGELQRHVDGERNAGQDRGKHYWLGRLRDGNGDQVARD